MREKEGKGGMGKGQPGLEGARGACLMMVCSRTAGTAGDQQDFEGYGL